MRFAVESIGRFQSSKLELGRLLLHRQARQHRRLRPLRLRLSLLRHMTALATVRCLRLFIRDLPVRFGLTWVYYLLANLVTYWGQNSYGATNPDDPTHGQQSLSYYCHSGAASDGKQPTSLRRLAINRDISCSVSVQLVVPRYVLRHRRRTRNQSRQYLQRIWDCLPWN